MKISESQSAFIEDHLHLVLGKGTTGIIEASDHDLLSIIIWDPLGNKDVTLPCPTHEKEQLRRTGIWTKREGKRPPRLLYNMGHNVLLVSAAYQCSICGCDSLFLATHPDILSQLPRDQTPPFHLFLKCGITRAGYEMIINATLAGTPFLEIAAMFGRSHGFHAGLHGKGQVENKHSSPSRDFIKDVFMYDYRLRLPYYEDMMRSIKFTDLSIDHTFYVRLVSHIESWVRSLF